MIDAYIRDSEDIKGVLLGRFEVDNLPLLVASVNKYPVYLGDYGQVKNKQVQAQYVIWEGEAYFEIVVIPEVDYD